jgi:predicted cupin superfamily sugar epimerase
MRKSRVIKKIIGEGDWMQSIAMSRPNKNRATTLINFFKMQPHPEGGHYCRTYTSGITIKKEALPDTFAGARTASSAIYFLLEGEQISALHRIKSDEIWHFYEGASLQLHIISPAGELIQPKLGKDLEAGETFQIVVPAGSWFGATIMAIDQSIDQKAQENRYSFFGCTVAPGFDFSDFELGQREELIKLYPEHREIICDLTKSGAR